MADQEVKITFRVDDNGTLRVFDAASSKMTEVGSAATLLSGKLAAAGLAAGAVSLAFSTLNNSINELDLINDLSERIGLSTEALSGLRVVARETDTDLESMAQSFARFARVVQNAGDPTSDMAAKLRALGVTSRDPETAIDQLAQTMSKLPDGFYKAATAQELFGRSGAKLIEALNQMGGGMRGLIDHADALGGKIGKDLARAGDEAKRSQADFKMALENTGIAISSIVIPLVTKLTGALTEFVTTWVGARKELDKPPSDRSWLMMLWQGAMTGSPVGALLSAVAGNPFLKPSFGDVTGGASSSAGTGQISEATMRAREASELLRGKRAEFLDAEAQKLAAIAEREQARYQIAKLTLDVAGHENELVFAYVAAADARQAAVEKELEARRAQLGVDEEALGQAENARAAADLTVKIAKDRAAVVQGEAQVRISQMATEQGIFEIMQRQAQRLQEDADLQERIRRDREIVRLDLGQSVSSAIQRAIDGVLQGGKSVTFAELIRGTGTAIAGEFVGGFVQAQLAKDKFDQEISENFHVQIPQMLADGANKMESIWSRLFGSLGGITTSGTNGIIGAFGAMADYIGGTLRNIPGLGGLFGGGGTGGAAISDTVGGIDLGLPLLKLRSQGFSALGAFSALAGGAMGGSVASSLLGGGIAGQTIAGAAGGAIGGAMLGSQIGSVGGPIGAVVGLAVGALISGLMAAFGSSGPTQEHINLDNIKDWAKKAGIRQAQGTLGGRSTWGDHSIIGRVFPGVTDVGPVQDLNNAILAITTAGLGNEQGQAGEATNAIANNANLLHQSLTQIRNDMRTLAETAGVTFESALSKLQEQFDSGYVTLDRFIDQTGQMTLIFKEDLPRALDTAKIAAKNMAGGVLDVRGYGSALDFQARTYQNWLSAEETTRMAGISLMRPRAQIAAQQQQVNLLRFLAGQPDVTQEERVGFEQQLFGLGQWFMQQPGRRNQQYGLGLMQESAGYMRDELDLNTTATSENTKALKDNTDAVTKYLIALAQQKEQDRLNLIALYAYIAEHGGPPPSSYYGNLSTGAPL